MPALRLALQFLTRLPVGTPDELPAGSWGRSLLYYPLVGLVLGLLLASAQVLLGASPALAAAAVLLLLWVLLTGALHLDGLADCADAWVGGQGDKERSLAIMKDATSGPVAVSVLVVLLLLKFSALASGITVGALIAVPVLARSALLVLFLTTPYVRPAGLASRMVAELPRQAAWKVTAGVGAAVLVLLGWQGILLLATAAAVTYGLRRILLARLGGFTGDGAGALVELVEAACLLVLVL